MDMTQQERQDYNKLTREQKEDFEYQHKRHPDWSFKQVMAKLVFEEKVDDTVGKGGQNVDTKDPAIWLTILEGVKSTLTKFQSIGQSIIFAIDSAIKSLKGMIMIGIQKAGDVISNLFDKLF